MLTIGPDPAHPHGGYAIIVLESDPAASAEISLAIRNSFNEKYLGEAGWQSVKAYFGPYRAEVEDGKAQFVVGTEIVNHIEEYTPITLEIGGQEFSASWPDDIMHGPPAATVGGVSPTPPLAGGDTGPVLVGSARTKEPKANLGGEEDFERDPGTTDPSHQEQPAGAEAAPETAAPEAKSRTPAILGGLGILAVLLAAGAYWYVSQARQPQPAQDPVEPLPLEEPTPAPEPKPVPEPRPVPEPEDLCTTGALRGLAGESHSALIDGLVGCGASVSADAALSLIENGVAEGDPAALMTLGKLYDGEVDIDVLETDIGLTFADNAARAAEYYARARDAGDGVGAEEALGTLCARLAEANDTLSLGAFEDFCE
ncbi:MAG: hypothetical protein AAF566_05750 [Pseudomonadota bacterium]